METIQLDCQGLACPGPVLKCRDILAEDAPNTLAVVVDNKAAQENVTRFLKTNGYEVVTEDGPTAGTFRLTATKSDTPAAECEVCTIMSDAEIASMAHKTTVLIASDTMGRGDDELGCKLMYNFLATLPELQDELWRVVLVNGGVKLAVENAPALEKLQDIEKMGVRILVCGTCLDHFNLLEQKAIGETTNMLDVVTSLQAADKVIRV